MDNSPGAGGRSESDQAAEIDKSSANVANSADEIDSGRAEETLIEALLGTGAEAQGPPDEMGDARPESAPESDGEAKGPPQRPLDPPKLVRLANLAREVLEEVRQMDPQDSTVQDLAGLYRRVEEQLKDALPEPLAQELDAMDLDMPFADGASRDDVRIAYSGLVGWLGGLFQGLHATLLAAAPLLQAGPDAQFPGQMLPGQSPQARPGLQPARPTAAEERKGEGYL